MFEHHNLDDPMECRISNKVASRSYNYFQILHSIFWEKMISPTMSRTTQFCPKTTRNYRRKFILVICQCTTVYTKISIQILYFYAISLLSLKTRHVILNKHFGQNTQIFCNGGSIHLGVKKDIFHMYTYQGQVFFSSFKPSQYLICKKGIIKIQIF